MKTCPPEVFWTSYHTHKPITRKNPLHFQDLVKKRRFLTNFFTSTKIFTCLVNKCWPKFFHDKKALIFPYTTLTSNFSYLLWLRKYFVLKINHTKVRFFKFTAIFSKENIRKNGQKNEKCQNFKNIFFRQFKRCDDMSMFGWKHVPQKCFEHLIILTNFS